MIDNLTMYDSCMILLRDIKTDVHEIRKEVSSINREVGSVQSTVSEIKNHSEWQDGEILEIRKKVFSYIPPISKIFPKNLVLFVVSFTVGVGVTAIVLWSVLTGYIPKLGG